MAARSPFSIAVAHEGERDVVTIAGVVDETSDLGPLTRLGERPIVVDLRGVRRINSYGVRVWLDAVRLVPLPTRLTFVHCPPPVVDQCNMVSGFLGHGTMQSFYGPMTCRECDEALDRLFEVAEVRAAGGKLPVTPCPRCKRPMEFDDLEDQYLLFVREG